ncbi:MAG: BlaI/MecI/CopY family transcriptional regulator [Gemmataceae bacterium]
MPPEPPYLDVTDAELAVLQTLWDHGPSTIRQLADILYPGGKAAQYGTVQKLLERLEAKGCVSRNREPWPHVFASAIGRDELIGWQLRQTAEKLCNGSMTPLLLHLLHTERFSASERQELRSFLERLRQDGSAKKG